MAAKKATKRASGKAPGAGEKSQADLVPPTRQTGPETATGMALASADQEIPQGEDRGAKVEPATAPAEDGKPTGAQTEPARFSSNGQLEHNTVGSPSGPVPVSTVAATHEAAEQKMAEVHEAHEASRSINGATDKELSEATVNRLGRAELMAIAGQRGYELEETGTRRTRAAFLEAQAADTKLQHEE